MAIEKARFTCPVPDCDAVFMTQLALQGHQTVHGSPRPHTCNMCGEVYDMAEWDACPRCDPEVEL